MACVASLTLTSALAFGVGARKSVALTVNGETTTVTTYAMSVDRLLQEQGVKVKTHDLVESTSPTSMLKNHDVVNVQSAYQTTITIDGQDIKNFANTDQAVTGSVTLPNGRHSIKVEIMDGFGNRASVTRTFTVKGRAAIPTLTLDAPSYALVGENYVVNVTSPNAGKIDSVTAHIVYGNVDLFDTDENGGKGAFNTCKAVCRQMARAKSGRIINISSVSGLMGNPGQANYAASKAGLIGLTKTLAKEYASRGVTCNAVAPCFIETEMTAAMPAPALEAAAGAIPAKRLGRPEDIAAAALFLASDGASYITGEVLKVDGGLYI